MLKVGDKYSYQFTFTQEQVDQFAKVTGDTNPLHVDPEYAAQTSFKKPIVHGMLVGSIISNVFGTKFPGAGTVYLSQVLNFKRPVFTDIACEGTFEIIAINEIKHIGKIKVEIKSQGARAKILVDGEAELKHSELF